MVQNSGGPAPYIYVSTRLRVRKAKLLPPEEYQRMLNMSLPEIIRLIGETEYQKEVDELGTSFEGIDRCCNFHFFTSHLRSSLSQRLEYFDL